MLNPDGERVIRQKTDVARSALHVACMSTDWWDFTAADAADKYNALPQKGSSSSSQSQFTSADPPIYRVQPFGPPEFVTVTEQLPKLVSRTRLCRYLRALNEHQLKVLEVATGRVRNCRVTEFSLTTYTKLHLHANISSHTVSAAIKAAPKSTKEAFKSLDADK